MDKEKLEKERSYNILVYGIEKLGLDAPAEPLKARNFSLTFEPFNSRQRLNEYDGVILFQGIFENFKRKTGFDSSYLTHSCDINELDKRKKEAQLLIKNGGFLCFLLNKNFIDSEDRRDFTGTDLTKYHLNYKSFHRRNFNKRQAHVDCKSDDFRKFLDVYGAASTHFLNYNSVIEISKLAEVGNYLVGMIINRNEYFIPTLIPDNRPDTIQEYFTFLTEGLTSSYNKLQVKLPEWIEEFSFDEEEKLSSDREALQTQISQIDLRHNELSQYKSVLALSGDELAESVSKLLSDGFGFTVDTKDELREDLKLLDSNSKPTCLCEVKGTNKGLKREHINQSDSHRERSKFDANFPTLLIINTHIRNARSLAEKDQDIASEQITHAVKMNVLIMRTFDLLMLLKMYLSKKIKLEDVESIFINNCGWLRVSDGKIIIITDNEPESKT